MSFVCSYFGPLDIGQFLTAFNMECTELTKHIRSTSKDEKNRAGTSAGMRNSAFRWSFSDKVVSDTFMLDQSIRTFHAQKLEFDEISLYVLFLF